MHDSLTSFEDKISEVDLESTYDVKTKNEDNTSNK